MNRPEEETNLCGPDIRNADSALPTEEEARARELHASVVSGSIREYRRLLGKSQKEFSALLGLTQQEVSAMERRAGSITVDQLRALKEIGVEVESFFNDHTGKDAVVNLCQTVQNLCSGGMLAVFPTRGHGLQSLIPYLRKERLAIHVVAATMQGLRMNRSVLDVIESRIKSGVELKLLVVHPALTCFRAFAEDRPTETIILEIDETLTRYLDKLKRISRRKEKQVEARAALVPSSMFAIFLRSQQRALINPYTSTIEAFSTPSLLIADTHDGECMYQRYYEHHFRDTWDGMKYLGREMSIPVDDTRMDKKQLNEARKQFETTLLNIAGRDDSRRDKQ